MLGNILDDNYEGLESKLGYRFKNLNLLKTALTHRSFVHENRRVRLADNERFEFLGDAVLDLIVAEVLMELYPKADEGALSRARSSLVSEPSLSELARSIDLGSWLRLGRGETLSGGRNKDSLLADAFEAVVASVYIDGGLESGEKTVRHLMGDRFKNVMGGEYDQDAKSSLQECLQADYSTVPSYRIVEEMGPEHKKCFTVELYVWGYCMGRGQGRSKKEAEQKAAAFFLEELQNGNLDLDSLKPSG